MSTSTDRNKAAYLQSRIDPETGLPEDYESLVYNYRPLVISLALKAGIPPSDVADVANELEFRFWRKNGLDWFDPEKKRKFSAMYWQWLSLSIRGERSRLFTYTERNSLTYDASVLANSAISDNDTNSVEWISEARKALKESGDEDLIRAFEVCMEAATDGRMPIIRELGMRSQTANKNLLKRLRKFLDETGLGRDSILK